MGSDPRQTALANWISRRQSGHGQPPQLIPLGGDAGFRRYFRFAWHQPLLAVDAPPASEDSAQFIAMANYLRSQGLRSPRIFASDTRQGFLLVEDFGDNLLYRELASQPPQALYSHALNELTQLQQCPDNPALIPRYDRPLLARELALFGEWFAGALLQHPITTTEQTQLNALFTLLEDSALAQPQVLVHRDYHSRNLLLCEDGRLGMIDFQGALWGAITYDLASLLKDCYYRLPTATVRVLALTHRQTLIEKGMIDVDEATFLRWFDWIGLQRHLKVLGIFARLALRDNKTNYLQDLPLVIRYCLETCNAYPALIPFANWFTQTLLPLAEQQAWYRDYQQAGDKGFTQ